MNKFFQIVLLIICIFIAQDSYGDLYIWIDALGVKHVTDKVPPKGAKVVAQIDDKSGLDYEKEFRPYFPVRSLSEDTEENDFYARWFTRHLIKMQEPVLWQHRSAEGEIYRFLLLRSFSNPVCIRINIPANAPSDLTVKVTNGTGGYQPGDLVENQTITLSKRQIEEFYQKLIDCDFWKVTHKKRRRGKDGAQWIVEGIKNGKYHVAHRWTPVNSDPIYQIGSLMLAFSKFNGKQR